MDCREAARFVQLRLDDEIEPVDCLQLDRHLESCPHCLRHVQAEANLKAKIKSKLSQSQSDVCAPSHLREHLVHRVRDERRTARLPVGRAMAACMGLFMVGLLSWSSTNSSDAVTVEEAVSKHSRHLPPEVRADASDERVNQFLQTNLGYPVAAPHFANQAVRPRLVGARLSSIRDRDVAYMMYDHRGARLSVFALPRGDEADRPEGFETRHVGGRVVHVGKRHGYNVVRWQHRGLSYSMVSDVDPAELVKLVSTAQ